MSPWRCRLGLALRRLRKDARLTQEQLATRLGVHIRSVQRVERGTSVPNDAVVNAWEIACGRHLDPRPMS